MTWMTRIGGKAVWRLFVDSTAHDERVKLTPNRHNDIFPTATRKPESQIQMTIALHKDGQGQKHLHSHDNTPSKSPFTTHCMNENADHSSNSDDGNIDPSNRPHATSPVASSTVESASSQAIRCELCDGEYSGKYARSNLGRHKRSKHDGQPQQYDCKDGMCDKTFLRSDARLKHYRTCHPDFANAAVPRRQLNTVSDPAPDPEVLREIWDP